MSRNKPLKHITLPKPELKYGYSSSQIIRICRKAKISIFEFWEEFGVNTCAIDDGMTCFYKCDVERTLHKLGFDTPDHEWD